MLGRLFVAGILGSVVLGCVLLAVVMYFLDLADGVSRILVFASVGIPLFLFLTVWRLSGLQRAMILENIEEYIGEIERRLDAAVDQFQRDGTPPRFETFRHPLARVAKDAADHPAVVALKSRIRDAETRTPV